MAPSKSGHAPGSAQPAVGDLVGRPSDPRVAAVLEVLGGGAVDDVARRWAVEPELLARWVTGFVEAGTAQVLNRPEAQALAQRDRFLAAFAFEIRTPLTVAMGWAGLLAEGELAPTAFVRTARRLQESLALLADRLVDVELLVAAAMGGLHIDRRPVPAGQVCQLPDVDDIGGAGPDTELHVDPVLFGRIIGDLWRAAGIAPTPRRRSVEVEVAEPWVEVRIVREADPIDTDTLRAMFEPFEFDQLRSGISIGLYLARALTVAHGGTLGIDQDDQRAVLWVKVPLRPDSAEPVTAPDPGGS